MVYVYMQNKWLISLSGRRRQVKLYIDKGELIANHVFSSDLAAVDK